MTARVPQTVPRHGPGELLWFMRAVVFCLNAEFASQVYHLAGVFCYNGLSVLCFMIVFAILAARYGPPQLHLPGRTCRPAYRTA